METIKTKTINVTGEDTGNTYIGEFKFKCLLSPLDRINIDREYRSMLGTNAQEAGIEAANLANILSELLFRIVDSAPFWISKESFIPGSHIPDRNVLLKVYEKALSCEAEYKQEIKEKVEKSKEEIKEKLDNEAKQTE